MNRHYFQVFGVAAALFEGTLVAFPQSAPDLVYLRALGDDAPAIDAVLRQSVERVSDGWRLPAVHLNRFHC